MRLQTSFLIVFLLTLCYSVCSTPFPGCLGDPNPYDIIRDNPVRVKSIPNGQQYQVAYDNRFLYVLNLTGSAYEMGLAHGTLMKSELKQLFKSVYSWLESYFSSNVTQIARLPKFIRGSVSQIGLGLGRILLRLTYRITQPYTPSRFIQELRGLSDGSGISVWKFIEVNMIAELTKASCSVFGAWGPASQNGQVMHMRTLDWDANAPMSQWPAIVIYHSSETGSFPFANIAWPGFIGTITGISTKIGIGEQAGDEPHQNETRFGQPWNFVLRDALQFSSNYQQAIYAMQNSRRTCSIYLGLGDRSFNTFRILEYSKPHVLVYDDTNWHFDEYHPQLTGVIWEEYDVWKNKNCFQNLVNEYYGQIDTEFMVKILAPSGQTGDSQVVAMDYWNYEIIVGYPKSDRSIPGYFRPSVFVDLKPFFFGNNN